MNNVVWFRNDLRVYDNPALSVSMTNGSSVGVYCLCEEQWIKHGISEVKKSMIVAQLKHLRDALSKLNVPLIVLDTREFANVPAALENFLATCGAKKLYTNYEYELNERLCHDEVVKKLALSGVQVFSYHDQCIIPPGKIVTQNGSCYKVYSAFKRAFFQRYSVDARGLYNLPSAQPPVDVNHDLSAIDAMELRECGLNLGEDEAHDRLNQFIETQLPRYHRNRDFPALDSTSGLSAYLAIGVLSTRQCLQAAMMENQGQLAEGKEGAVAWINELIWREFYRHILVAFPELCKHEPFLKHTEALPWSNDQKAFERWKNGLTGYPLVDAAMRQLNETGWMHNRLRMVTAMFLTKDLMVDWRWGERYFMSKLVDGDFASNNGGWQWSASTGVDAVPYFRVFNPYRQSERFDPNGDFIRKFVPELAHLSGKHIHQPTPEQAFDAGYPSPIVNHSQAAARVKEAFKQLATGHSADFGKDEQAMNHAAQAQGCLL